MVPDVSGRGYYGGLLAHLQCKSVWVCGVCPVGFRCSCLHRWYRRRLCAAVMDCAATGHLVAHRLRHFLRCSSPTHHGHCLYSTWRRNEQSQIYPAFRGNQSQVFQLCSAVLHFSICRCSIDGYCWHNGKCESHLLPCGGNALCASSLRSNVL